MLTTKPTKKFTLKLAGNVMINLTILKLIDIE